MEPMRARGNWIKRSAKYRKLTFSTCLDKTTQHNACGNGKNANVQESVEKYGGQDDDAIENGGSCPWNVKMIGRMQRCHEDTGKSHANGIGQQDS